MNNIHGSTRMGGYSRIAFSSLQTYLFAVVGWRLWPVKYAYGRTVEQFQPTVMTLYSTTTCHGVGLTVSKFATSTFFACSLYGVGLTWYGLDIDMVWACH
ncbi:unnamed protein product [Choristocarpus tenellus]